MSAAESDETASEVETHRVVFVTPEGEAYEIDAPEDEYLIVAASRAGLELPSGCLQGWCLTCASRLLEGEVDQSESKRYYEEDEEAGFVLPCSGYPRSDCRILVRQRDEMIEHREDHDLPYSRW